MKKLSVREQIDKRIAEEMPKVAKKHGFGKRRKFIDPNCGLVFDRCDSLEENKNDYHKAIRGISRGDYADLYAAHKAIMCG